MKLSKIYVLFLAVAAFAFAASASTLSQKAADELAAARAEYSQILKTNEANAAAVRKKLDTLYAEISATETAIENALRESAKLDALALSDTRAESLAQELSMSAQSSLRDFNPRARSAFEVYTSLKSALPNALDSLANPLKMRPITATDPKTGAEYSGHTFRVGGFSYFVSTDTAGFLTPDNNVYGRQYASAIRDFSESKTRKIPADISGGSLFKTEKSATSIREQIELGGVWIYPILFLGALSCATALAKIPAFARANSAKKAAQSGRLPREYAEVLRLVQNSPTLQQKQSAVYDAVLRYNLRLNRGKSALSVSAAVAPLFGLLGTVSGIIKTFSDLATSHSAQTDAVSEGIAEALITTEYGLIVAIPALVAAALISRAAKFYSDSLGDFAADHIAADPAAATPAAQTKSDIPPRA